MSSNKWIYKQLINFSINKNKISWHIFRENIKRLSKLFLDRPMSAMDTAIYWVEYTARHGNILKSPATKLSWWEYYLIDVYGLVLLCIAVVLYITKFILKLLWRLVCSRKSSQAKSTAAKAKKNKWKCFELF